MRQIPSIFLDDDEYNMLIGYKEESNLTWKQLMLSVLKNEDNANNVE